MGNRQEMTDFPGFYQNFGGILDNPFVATLALFRYLITAKKWPKFWVKSSHPDEAGDVAGNAPCLFAIRAQMGPRQEMADCL